MLSRRSFLRGASSALGLCAAAASGRFSLLERAASAASLSGYGGYRALVGLFLLGGNDSNNMVIPNTTAGYALYAASRTSSNIGIPQASLLPLGTGTYGLHPKMPKLQGLFNTQKNLALVFNVGTLVQPTSLTDYNAIVAGTSTKRLPDHLFSHIDQQTAWSTAVPDPSFMFATGPTALTNTGWGGRVADLVAPLNPLVGGQVFPPLVWYGGTQVFGTGEIQSSLSVASNGTLALSGSGSSAADAVRLTALNEIMTSPQMKSGIAPEDAFTGSFANALAYSGVRTAAINGNPLSTSPTNPLAAIAALFPNTTLGVQLLHITQDIIAGASAANKGLGLKRQLFSAALGGFDTHTSELSTHNSLYGQMDDALDAFYTAIEMLNTLIGEGMLPGITQALEVTLFTMSDFSRTFQPNSSGGTDHGWGSHMMVLGSQVKGGATYGTFPDLTITSGTTVGANDVGEGRWLPTTSSDEYENVLATWLGISTADQAYVFPRLSNFSPLPTNIGFMSA